MKLSQDFASMAAVKPVITSVAVRKPNKHEFVRVRPGAEWRFETGCFIEKETRETYLVTPELWPAMPGDVTPTALGVHPQPDFVSVARWRVEFTRTRTAGGGTGAGVSIGFRRVG